ncbi:MAG TPA: hypothetical protein VJU80_00475 [Solirubrobacteraceae bacterium]|nr:hypothetical protein [Solirubrobacteraceae bacterium]
MTPDLDHWLQRPTLRVAHARETTADADALWEAARSIQLREAGLLGRLVRWRIPGTGSAVSFDALFRNPPFIVLDDSDRRLVSGLVGRIWTLRRDYPQLADPEEFRGWSKGGTARVMFAHWAEDGSLHSEARVEAFGARGRAGVAAVRPLVRAFHPLIFSDGLAAAVRRAEELS